MHRVEVPLEVRRLPERFEADAAHEGTLTAVPALVVLEV